MTFNPAVPSSIGLICTYFSGRDQNLVMVGFGGTGSFAFTFGVVFGGVLSGRSTIPYLTQISQTSEQEASAGYAETPNSEMMRLTSTRLALPQRYIFRILALLPPFSPSWAGSSSQMSDKLRLPNASLRWISPEPD